MTTRIKSEWHSTDNKHYSISEGCWASIRLIKIESDDFTEYAVGYKYRINRRYSYIKSFKTIEEAESFYSNKLNELRKRVGA